MFTRSAPMSRERQETRRDPSESALETLTGFPYQLRPANARLRRGKPRRATIRPFRCPRWRRRERRRMAPKKAAVNLANLEALGAKRLAEILLELGSGDAGIKRRLRLELSAEAGAEAVAADIGKRITTLRQARSFVDWQKRRAFVKDLDLQRQLIVDKVARDRPDLALELLWRFMGLAEPVLNRVDDSRGDVGDVFHQACHDLGAVALAASPDPVRLADRVFEAVTTNDYGEYDRLVELVFPALEGAGGARLKERLTAILAERPKTKDRFDIRASALRRALQDIADGEGDIDAFIAHET